MRWNNRKSIYSIRKVLIGWLAYCAIMQMGCADRAEIELDRADITQVKVIGRYTGKVRAYQTVELRLRVEGYLDRMLFDEGKKVKKNEPLFQINAERYKARVEKAKAQLKKDEAQLARAKRDVGRLRPLYEQNAASQLDLDHAIAELEFAEANVAMSKADLYQAELELGYTTVYSPLTGYVVDRKADIGTLLVGGSSLLAHVINIDTVYVDVELTALDYLQSMRRKVRLGETDSVRLWQPSVRVTLADNSLYSQEGIIDFAAPKVDDETGVFFVRAKLPNPENSLLPGQVTNVQMLLHYYPAAMMIPLSAIKHKNGEAFIFIVKNGKLERRKITIGPEYNKYVVVESGLLPDEVFVARNVEHLQGGTAVSSSFRRGIRNLPESVVIEYKNEKK